jgi:hypothetical protein
MTRHATQKARKADPLRPTFDERYDSAGHFVPEYDCDLRDLRDGKKGVNGFSGRPGLASQIVNEDFLVWLSGLARMSVYAVKWSLNHLWKSLDGHEEKSGCERVDDVRLLIKAPWSSFRADLSRVGGDRRAGRLYYFASKSVQRAVNRIGLDHELPKNAYWGAFRQTAQRRLEESPYDAETEEKLLEAFANHRHKVIERIDRHNALADAGDDPKETLARSQAAGHSEFDRVWTVENSARFIRDHAMLDFTPTKRFEAIYGPRILQRLHEFFPPNSDVPGMSGAGALYGAFLPKFADFTTWPREIVLKAGINEQAAYDFDRTDWYEQVGPNRALMHTRKIRKKGNVVEFGSDMGPDDPWGIVASAIRLGQPHHDRLTRELDRLEALPAKQATKKKLRRRIQRLKALQSRVWLALGLRAFDIKALTSRSLDLHRTNNLLRGCGLTEGEGPLEWSPRRARDGFGYDLWLDSDRFLPAVVEGMHHERSGQSSDYLEHPLSRQEDAIALLQIWEKMRKDLYHLAEHGRRPGPDPLEVVVPSLQSMTLFGPAREWLASGAPGDVLQLLGSPLEQKGAR